MILRCKIKSKTANKRKNLGLLSILLLVSTPNWAELSLQQTLRIAVQNDPWLAGNNLQEQAMLANSDAAATLADPVVSIGIANLPTDGFSFNQEPMTQLKIGVTQQFSRGNSLALKKQQLLEQAGQYPYLRQDRQAKIKVSVAELWLTIFTTQQRILVIEKSRPLFAQLVDIAQAHYSSAQGTTRQQDIVNAQVQLARLEDRLSALKTQRDTQLAKLDQWLYSGDELNAQWQDSDITDFPKIWPTLPAIEPAVTALLQPQQRAKLAQYLAQHPAVLAIEQQIKSANSAVQLAEQQYQPQWGINASYAYRDNDPIGNNRADFLSIGLSVDVPLFTTQKQDKTLQASRLQTEAIKTEKWLALRSLLSQLLATWQNIESLHGRIQHYSVQIMPQMAEQSEAALTAYTTDDGNFSDVMRIDIAQLDIELEYIELQNQHAIRLMQLQYFVHNKSQQLNRTTFGEQP